MFGRLAEHPVQLLILLLVILLVFGASRLPNTARQLGRSMRIFKSEMNEMKADGTKAKPKRDDVDDDKASDIDALEGRVVDGDRDTADRAADRAEADRER
jgi:sec-independent protein translocase protein TatA